jgi:phytoene dehydrogenase-like protein
MATTLNSFYKLKDDGQILKLRIDVGYGQIAASNVYLGEVALALSKKDSFELSVSPPQSGKPLICMTAVTDIVEETNYTSIKYYLEGGVKTFTQTLEESVEQAGGTLFYTATFHFYL